MEENLVYAGFIALTAGAALGLYLFFVRYRQHKSADRRWWKLLLGNLLILLFAGSLAVLAGETYFRFWYDATDSVGITKTNQRWFARHYHRNRMGFRDDQEYSDARAPRKRRITFVGDSFAAGQGIRDVADRFANRIAKMHPDWEVQVLAQPGWDSGDEMTFLARQAGTTYEFDLVVLVYCLNDIGDATPELADRWRRIMERCRRPAGFLVEHSYLLNTLYYRTLMRRFPEISGYFAYQHDAYFGRAWEAHTPRLRAMRDIVRDRGGEFCVVTFPYMNLMGPNYEFRDVHRRLDDFWRRIGVAHLDLLPIYAPYSPGDLVVNARDAHPNEFAHGLAAGAISRFLAGQAWLEPRAIARI